MAALVFQITDGTTQIDFDGSGDFETRTGWRPAIATRRRSRMGNQPFYNDVVEEIPITVKGTNVDDIIANEIALVNLIDQAQSWYDGNGDSAVLFKYRNQDSSLASAAQCCIIGYAGAVLEHVDNDFMFASNNLARRSILRFMRRGEWLGAEDGDASSSTPNPGVMVATNTATALESPVRIQMTNYFATTWGQSFFILSDESIGSDIVTASTATASGFTSVNDATNLPFHATNILRYTAAGTSWAQSGAVDISGMMLSATKRIGIFANIRRASGAEMVVKGKITSGMSTGTENKETRPIALADHVNPQWYYIGNIYLSADLQKLTTCNFYFMAKATAAAQIISIDSFAFFDLDTVQIIGLLQSSIHSDVVTLGIDHNLDSDPFPIVYHIDGDSTVTTTANGDLMLVAQNAAVNVVWLANGVFDLEERWCAVDPGSGTRLSNVLTAVRRPAYLVPQ